MFIVIYDEKIATSVGIFISNAGGTVTWRALQNHMQRTFNFQFKPGQQIDQQGLTLARKQMEDDERMIIRKVLKIQGRNVTASS
jgi:hypothetical protein